MPNPEGEETWCGREGLFDAGVLPDVAIRGYQAEESEPAGPSEQISQGRQTSCLWKGAETFGRLPFLTNSCSFDRQSRFFDLSHALLYQLPLPTFSLHHFGPGAGVALAAHRGGTVLDFPLSY